MNEWGVVGVIIALAGLIGIFAKVSANLSNVLTKLSVVVDRLEKTVETNQKGVHESFQKVWKHEYEQDGQLTDHETRIRLLEAADE